MSRLDAAAFGAFLVLLSWFVGLGIELEYAAIVLPNLAGLVALALVLRAKPEALSD